MDIRIAGIEEESFVDGEGIRFAIFFQGCLRKCFNCQNPATHDINGGKILDTKEIILQIKKNPMLTGITLTGGEPFLQILPAIELANFAKNFGLNVWCYTGYNFENLPKNSYELLQKIDVLVDGEYIDELRDLELKFCGSKNQRIIDVQKTLAKNKIILWSDLYDL